MAVNFKVNGSAASVDAPADTSLLWAIREQLKLAGTKFGCGAGLCGACMVPPKDSVAQHHDATTTACRRTNGVSVPATITPEGQGGCSPAPTGQKLRPLFAPA